MEASMRRRRAFDTKSLLLCLAQLIAYVSVIGLAILMAILR